MRFFRKHWRAIISAVAAAIFFPVVGEWFIALAREYGFYSAPSEQLRAVIDGLLWIVGLPGFHSASLFVAGTAAGIWIDTFVRKQERKLAASAAVVKRRYEPKDAIEAFIDRELRNSRDVARNELKPIEAEWQKSAELTREKPFGGGTNFVPSPEYPNVEQARA